MKELMKYLLRSRRGLRAALGLPIVIILAAHLLAGISYLTWGNIVDVPVPLLCEFIVEELLQDLAHIEALTLIGAAFGFLMLCANAFRFGMANGVSRRSVFKAVTLSAVITSAAVTLITRFMVYLDRYGVNCIYDETLYISFFNRNSIGRWDLNTYEPILEPNDSYIRGGTLFWRETVMFFILALITLTAIASGYALFRRWGLFGALCGVLGMMTCQAVVFLLHEFPTSLGAAFFDISRNDVWTGTNERLFTPRPVPIMILAGIIIGAEILTNIMALKKTGIKPQSL
ncbi:MAG: hypothetical protein K6B74_13305 [Ruminococcus sp.]|nr:hypothetical protein [Ruminococcus sp.]